MSHDEPSQTNSYPETVAQPEEGAEAVDRPEENVIVEEAASPEFPLREEGIDGMTAIVPTETRQEIRQAHRELESNLARATRKARKKSKRKSSPLDHEGQKQTIVVSGYYGFDNLGDELILSVIVQELKKRNLSVVVLSNNPEKTEKIYGVRAVKRMDMIDVIDVMAEAQLFLSGGGGLFQDATGLGSVIYYGGLICMASFFKVPAILFAQGIGPLKNPFTIWVTQQALKRCKHWIVRDETSATFIEALVGQDAVVAADLVWLLDLQDMVDIERPVDCLRIGLSLRPHDALDEFALSALAQRLVTFFMSQDKPAELILFSFQPDQDDPILTRFEEFFQMHIQVQREVRHATQKEAPPIVQCKYIPVESVMQTIGSCHGLIGMRFHSLLLAISAGIPVYGLIYDPKVRNLLRQFDLHGVEMESLENLPVDALQKALFETPIPDVTAKRLEAQKAFDAFDHVLAELDPNEILV